jgi:transposase of ISAar4, IS3 family, IS3 group, orfB
MCHWASLSRSGYYAWLNRGWSKTRKHREELTILIKHFFKESGQTHGYRRIHETLVQHGIKTCLEVVRQVMNEEGLRARKPRRRESTSTKPS